MKIEEELKRFFLNQQIKAKIMPSEALPEYLQRLQHYVLLAHSGLDKFMLIRILYEIRYEAGEDLSEEVWEKIELTIQDALEVIPYKDKVFIISDYGDMSTEKELVKALRKVNTYRNWFAHRDARFLRAKYDLQTSAGKVEIRNLIGDLERAEDLFLAYAESSKVCSYCIRRAMEQMSKRAGGNPAQR